MATKPTKTNQSDSADPNGLTATVSEALATPPDSPAASVAVPYGIRADRGADVAPPANLIPGGDIIGRGIYLRPRQPYELKPVLFNLTPEDNPFKTYARPSSGKTFSFPARSAVNPSPPLPADQSFGQTLIEESWSRFGKQMSTSASASASSKSVSIDASAFQASSVKSDEDSYYALRSSFVPLWDLYLPCIPDSLSEELEAQIPKNWQGKYKFDWGNRADYSRIFDRYGTHFVKNVWVGGKASLVFTIAKSTNLKTDEIRAAVQASLVGMAKGSVEHKTSSSLETFRSNSSCKVFGSGGNGIKLAKLSEFSSDAYNAWLDTVEELPAAIQLGVAGIWTLIKDKDKAAALKEAYTRETNFVPLTAIVPIGPYYIFLKDSWGFVIDYLESPYGSKVKSLSTANHELKTQANFWAKTIKANASADETANAAADKYLKQDLPPEPDPRLKLENIKTYFSFFNDRLYREFSRPQAALSMNVFQQQHDKVLLFRHKKCLLIDFNISVLEEVEPVGGYPKLIADIFPGVDVDRVDAALSVPPNKVYLFSGPDYYRITVNPDGTSAPAVKEKIARGWPGVDFERLDTAVYWKNNKVYFFYEDQYIRYDVSNHRADPGYPKSIASNYVEDWDFFD